MTIDIEKFISLYEKEISNPPQNIFEIGAREANDAIKLKIRYPNSRVCAFEAHPDCYNFHYNNVIKNNVEYYNIGMWNSEKELIFYDKNIDSGISSFRDRGQQYGQRTLTLKTSTPKKFIIEQKIESVDILKIDVEGCTYEILEGFEDNLYKIKFMHIETEQQEHFAGQVKEEVVFNYLKDNNFTLLEHSWCCLSQYDSVWINNKL